MTENDAFASHCHNRYPVVCFVTRFVASPDGDSNPCYRRERDSRIRKLLKLEDTDGYQSASKEPKGTLIGRQSDARICYADAAVPALLRVTIYLAN